MEEKKKFTIEVFTKEYYDEVFEKIVKIPANWYPSKITEFIRKKMFSRIFMVLPIKAELLKSFEIYRARVLSEGEQIDENNISSFSYPPRKINGKLIKMGRVNRKGQQVFYGSVDKHTTIIELDSLINLDESVVYISTWGIKNVETGVNMKAIFSGLNVDKDSYSAVFTRMVDNGFKKIFQNIPEPHLENLHYAQKKYQELFTSSGKKLYHISSSIAHEIFVRYMKQKVNVPIIAYPSVAKKKESINFAIKKKFVDSHLYLKRIDKVLITSIKNEELNYKGLRRAIVENDKIKWLNLDVQVEPINYESVFLYLEESKEPKRHIHIQDNDKLLSCCENHSFSAKHYIENMMKLSEEQIIHYLTNSIPIDDFEKKTKLNYLMAIPPNQDIFIKTTEKLNPVYFIGLNIDFTLEYK